MKILQNINKMKKGLRKYILSVEKYACPMDEGVLAAYASEMNYPLNHDIDDLALDLCDLENIESQMFLHIADHWLKIRRDFPSGVMAFKDCLPPLLDPKADLDYQAIQRVDKLTREYYQLMEGEFKKLRSKSDRFIQAFTTYRYSLESLDEHQKWIQRRRYDSLVFIILPCLYGLTLFLSTTFIELNQNMKIWRKYKRTSCRSLLELLPLPENIHKNFKLTMVGIVSFVLGLYLNYAYEFHSGNN